VTEGLASPRQFWRWWSRKIRTEARVKQFMDSYYIISVVSAHIVMYPAQQHLETKYIVWYSTVLFMKYSFKSSVLLGQNCFSVF
jgi:hypothetical protein